MATKKENAKKPLLKSEMVVKPAPVVEKKVEEKAIEKVVEKKVDVPTALPFPPKEKRGFGRNDRDPLDK